MNIKTIKSIILYPISFCKFKNFGLNLSFCKGGIFSHPEEISFGSNIFIGPKFHISASNLVFGNNILIGPNFLLEGEDHIFNKVGKFIWETRSIKNKGYNIIEDDVWIGGNVTILKNVTIGEGCVIGAGSIVTKSLPPYTICVGIPCKPIKKRFSKDELHKHLVCVNSKYNVENI